MSGLTPSERERTQAAIIAAALDIMVDELEMIIKESQLAHPVRTTREEFMAFRDNLAARAQDYHDMTEVVTSGDVKVVNRERD